MTIRPTLILASLALAACSSPLDPSSSHEDALRSTIPGQTTTTATPSPFVAQGASQVALTPSFSKASCHRSRTPQKCKFWAWVTIATTVSGPVFCTTWATCVAAGIGTATAWGKMAEIDNPGHPLGWPVPEDDPRGE